MFTSSSSYLLATNWIGLRKLQELDVSDNKLTELPALFLHSFKSLSYLNASRNNLRALPDAWACPLVGNFPETVGAAVSPTELRGCTMLTPLGGQSRSHVTAERVCH